MAIDMDQIINDYISEDLVTDRAVLPLRNDTPLLDSNILDSVAVLSLVMFLEQQFGISITIAEVQSDNFRTIDTICAFVRSRMEQAQGQRAQA